ncbi:uncharacterized protein LOC144716116 [Wolffia australiana]
MELCCRSCPPSISSRPISRNRSNFLGFQPKRNSAIIPYFFEISCPVALKDRSRSLPVAKASDPTSTSASSPNLTIDSGAAIVKEFYDRINRRDVASVAPLISDECVYEDLVFASPFVGRKAILDFFKEFSDSISSDLQFVIDDITTDDSSAIGVTWHLEWRGKTFPFSKGCSFYRLDVINGRRQIVYGRDCVEPALKPGEMALVAIKAVTSLLQRFPQLADNF